ncbi:MAG: YraN family protein [Bacteroidetes bacterium]|nr:YraN family protein [Bacteroidota bacterium]MBS1650246.1 YraN family protein [Bacteroidota bacterium]
MNKNKDKGNQGENIASDYLLKKGYAILHRNWRHKQREIDIIAAKNNTLHFIEVKTRTSNKFGLPEESISDYKMNALKKAAEAFLLQNAEWNQIQFDVVAITLSSNKVEEIFIIEDVFF